MNLIFLGCLIPTCVYCCWCLACFYTRELRKPRQCCASLFLWLRLWHPSARAKPMLFKSTQCKSVGRCAERTNWRSSSSRQCIFSRPLQAKARIGCIIPNPEVQQLRDLVLNCKPVNELEKKQAAVPQVVAQAPSPVPPTEQNATTQNSISKEDRSVLDFFKGTTINGALDGYYGFNFQTTHRPASNLLRAYDVQQQLHPRPRKSPD